MITSALHSPKLTQAQRLEVVVRDLREHKLERSERNALAQLFQDGRIRFWPGPHPLTEHEKKTWTKLLAQKPNEIVFNVEELRRKSPDMMSDEQWEKALAGAKRGLAHPRGHRWGVSAMRDKDEMIAYLESDNPLTVKQQNELADRLSGTISKIGKAIRQHEAQLHSVWNSGTPIDTIQQLIVELRARGDDALADQLESRNRGGQPIAPNHRAAELYDHMTEWGLKDPKTGKPITKATIRALAAKEVEFEFNCPVKPDAVHDTIKNAEKKHRRKGRV